MTVCEALLNEDFLYFYVIIMVFTHSSCTPMGGNGRKFGWHIIF